MIVVDDRLKFRSFELAVAFSSEGGLVALFGRAGPGLPGREPRAVVNAADVAVATVRPDRLSVRTVLRGTVASVETDKGPLASVTIGLLAGDQLIALTTRMAVHERSLGRGDRVFALIRTVALDERRRRSLRPQEV